MKIKGVKKFFKKEHLSRPLIKYFYYPIAIFISWIYINLGISAHIVSLMGLAANIVAAILIFNRVPLPLAGLLIIFAYVSDLCDGTVARAYDKKNAMGKWLDESSGLLGLSLIFFTFMMKTYLETSDITLIYLGFLALFGYLMINYSATLSGVIRGRFNLDNPTDKVRKKISKRFFGINPALFSFSFDVQWTIIILAVIFNLPYALFIVFGILANLQWMARYAIFFGK